MKTSGETNFSSLNVHQFQRVHHFLPHGLERVGILLGINFRNVLWYSLIILIVFLLLYFTAQKFESLIAPEEDSEAKIKELLEIDEDNRRFGCVPVIASESHSVGHSHTDMSTGRY